MNTKVPSLRDHGKEHDGFTITVTGDKYAHWGGVQRARGGVQRAWGGVQRAGVGAHVRGVAGGCSRKERQQGPACSCSLWPPSVRPSLW